MDCQVKEQLKRDGEDGKHHYRKSLGAIEISVKEHDIRFEEDNWEPPTLGAWGIGWQVMLDGLEVTQFTYFQQCGGVDYDPISAVLTYGLERMRALWPAGESNYDVGEGHEPEREDVPTQAE